MSYYALKCVYCLEQFANADIGFRLDEMENKTEADSDADGLVPERFDMDDDFDEDEEDNDDEEDEEDDIFGGQLEESIDDSRSVRSQGVGLTKSGTVSLDDQKVMKLSQLRKAHPEATFTELCTQEARMSRRVYEGLDPDHKPQTLDGSVVTEVEVRGIRLNGQIWNGRLTRRRCACCGKPLPAMAGILPVFTVGLFGHSTAGKTVYLTTQCALGLFNDRLCQDVHKGRVYLSADISHIERDGSKDSIYEAARRFMKDGRYPTTTGTIPPPHCVKVSYRPRKASGELATEDLTTCIISFQDIMGEIMNRDTDAALKDEDERKVIELFRKADALMLFTDPQMLEMAKEHIGHEAMANHAENAEVVEGMMNKIEEFIGQQSFRADQRPTVSIITKQDVLVANKTALGISGPEYSAALATGTITNYIPYQNWSRNTMQRLDSATRKILEKLDFGGGWASSLELHFTRALHLPMSSIGSRVSIMKAGGQVKLVTLADKHYFQEGLDKAKAAKDAEWEEELNEAFRERKAPPDLRRLVEPYCLEIPLQYFLMRFHIIPPLHEESFFEGTAENYEAIIRKNRLKKPGLFANDQKQAEFREKVRKLYVDAKYRKWKADYRQEEDSEADDV